MSGEVASLAEARAHNIAPDVFLRHWREIRDCKDAHHDTGMALARAKKAAKKDGIDLDALKDLEKLAALETDERALRQRHVHQYAGWIDLPIGIQLDAFDKPSDAEVQKQRDFNAKQAGEAAGKAGHERQTNPHQVGKSEHVAWDKAWTKGNKVWLTGQKSLAGDLARNARASKGSSKRRSNGAAATTH